LSTTVDLPDTIAFYGDASANAPPIPGDTPLIVTKASADPRPVPEPGTLFLAGLALVLAAVLLGRTRK